MQAAAASRAQLMDLDDGLLLAIMKELDPMPNWMNLSRTCLRFKRLAHDRRNYLVVAPTTTAVGSTAVPDSTSARTQPVPDAHIYRTIASAIAASRPGDTLLLLPGTHQCMSVRINNVLSLVGTTTEDGVSSVLYSSTPGEPALDIRATCRLAHVTIKSNTGPCVKHRCGHLQLDNCHLTCDAHGLEHLCSPLVMCPPPTISTSTTTATSRTGAIKSSNNASSFTGSFHPADNIDVAAIPDLKVGSTTEKVGLMAHVTPPAESGEGYSRVTVTECLLEGGNKAVAPEDCWADLQLQSVRVIMHSRKQVFYLEADCKPRRGVRFPGHRLPVKRSRVTGVSLEVTPEPEDQHRISKPYRTFKDDVVGNQIDLSPMTASDVFQAELEELDDLDVWC